MLYHLIRLQRQVAVPLHEYIIRRHREIRAGDALFILSRRMSLSNFWAASSRPQPKIHRTRARTRAHREEAEYEVRSILDSRRSKTRIEYRKWHDVLSCQNPRTRFESASEAKAEACSYRMQKASGPTGFLWVDGQGARRTLESSSCLTPAASGPTGCFSSHPTMSF